MCMTRPTLSYNHTSDSSRVKFSEFLHSMITTSWLLLSLVTVSAWFLATATVPLRPFVIFTKCLGTLFAFFLAMVRGIWTSRRFSILTQISSLAGYHSVLLVRFYERNGLTHHHRYTFSHLFLSLYLSVYLSVHLSLHLSVYLSVSSPVSLSISLTDWRGVTSFNLAGPGTPSYQLSTTILQFRDRI